MGKERGNISKVRQILLINKKKDSFENCGEFLTISQNFEKKIKLYRTTDFQHAIDM